MMIGHQDQVVAWSGDNLVEVRVFELPRYYNNIDMRDFDFKLDTEINGVKNIIDLPKTVIGEDNIILVWTIAESHVTIPGRMFIQIRAFSADEEKWHSSQDYVFVQSSINATDAIPSPLPSEFEQMEQRVTAAKNEAQGDAQTATEQVNATQNMLDTFSTITLSEAIAAIESAGQAKVDLAEVQADRAQDIADTLENITVPAAITAIESAGQALGVKWVTPSGGMELIDEIVLAANDDPIEFTAIPQTYASLYMEVLGRVSETGTAITRIYMQLGNGSYDTGSNYAYRVQDSFSSSTSYSDTTVMASRTTFPQNSASAGAVGMQKIVFPDYTNTNFWKLCKGESVGVHEASSEIRHGHGGGVWKSTSAIERIKIVTGMAANTVVRLWGIPL